MYTSPTPSLGPKEPPRSSQNLKGGPLSVSHRDCARPSDTTVRLGEPRANSGEHSRTSLPRGPLGLSESSRKRELRWPGPQASGLPPACALSSACCERVKGGTYTIRALRYCRGSYLNFHRAFGRGGGTWAWASLALQEARYHHDQWHLQVAILASEVPTGLNLATLE